LAYLLDLNLGSSSTLAPSFESKETKMSEERSVACSLGAGELEQRAAAIAAIGRVSLVSRAATSGRHLLRFHADAGTRRRLEEIVAAAHE